MATPAAEPKRGSGGLVIALFGVVLLAGLALGGFYYYKKVYLPKQAVAPETAQQTTIPSAPAEAPAPVPQDVPTPVSTPPPAVAEPATIAPPPKTQRTPVETSMPRREAPAPVVQQPVTAPQQAATPAPMASTPQTAPVPVETAPAPAPAPVRETPPPAVKAPAPTYSGPTSGVVVWSGRLEKNGTITINGASASSGSLQGALPAVPVMVEVQPNDVGVVEAPGPSNGWKRMVLRSRVNRNSVVTIRWQALGR